MNEMNAVFLQPCIKMHLLRIIAILGFSILQVQQNFGEVSVTNSQGHFFHSIGKVYSSNSFAHLHINYKISDLNERANFLRTLNSGIKSLQIPNSVPFKIREEAKNRLKFVQQSVDLTTTETITRLSSTLQALHSNFSIKAHRKIYRPIKLKPPFEYITRDKKQKRQVVIPILVGILGGAIAGSIAAEVSEEDVTKVIQEKQDMMSTTIQNNLVSLKTHEEEIRLLNKSIDEVTSEFTEAFLRIESNNFETILLSSSEVVKTVAATINKVSAALINARYGHLDLTNIPLEQVEEALKSLNAQSVQHGYQLSTTNPLDLQECPSSYLVDPNNMEIHLIIHISMFQPTKYLNLYKFINFPIPAVTNETHSIFMELNPPNQFLAITLDHTKYVPLQNLDDCLHHKEEDNYLCPLVTFYTRSTPNCLYSIFQNDQDQIKDICPILIRKPYPISVRISQNSWFLLENAPESSLTITCTNSSSKHVINSTVLVTMDANCDLVSENIILHFPLYEPSSIIKGIRGNLTLDPNNLLELRMANVDEFKKTIHSIIQDVGQPIDLALVTRLTNYKKEMEAIEHKNRFKLRLPSFVKGLLPSISTVVICVLMYFAVLKCGPILINRCCSKKLMSEIPLDLPPKDGLPTKDGFEMKEFSALPPDNNDANNEQKPGGSMIWGPNQKN